LFEDLFINPDLDFRRPGGMRIQEIELQGAVPVAPDPFNEKKDLESLGFPGSPEVKAARKNVGPGLPGLADAYDKNSRAVVTVELVGMKKKLFAAVIGLAQLPEYLGCCKNTDGQAIQNYNADPGFQFHEAGLYHLNMDYLIEN
jgi:hypothetical protein